MKEKLLKILEINHEFQKAMAMIEAERKMRYGADLRTLLILAERQGELVCEVLEAQ